VVVGRIAHHLIEQSREIQYRLQSYISPELPPWIF
jgi:hypothetical protein